MLLTLTDYMEMMMMQNAQMHQMVLQHMMLNTSSSLDNKVLSTRCGLCWCDRMQGCIIKYLPTVLNK